MSTSDYQELSDEDKSKKIEDFTDKSRIAARVAYVNEKTKGLKGTELKSKLAELKSNGILNKEVFTKWQNQ